MPAKPTNCQVAIFLPGQPALVEADVIGVYRTQEAGAFGDRRWDVVLTRNKAEACARGADAIEFEQVETPTSMKPFYSSVANFLAMRPAPSATPIPMAVPAIK